MRNVVAFGALMVAACAFVNMFVGVTVIGKMSGGEKFGAHRLQGTEQHEAPLLDKSREKLPIQQEHSFQHDQRPIESQDGRFPVYGTESFDRQCAWTMRNMSDQSMNCTVLVRPVPPYMFEGVSNWVSTITTGHILAQLAGCKLLFDYGKGVNVQDVLIPWSISLGHPPVNWTVPSGFDCDNDSHCLISPPFHKKGSKAAKELDIESILNMQNELPSTPHYRYALRYARKKVLYKHNFRDLEHDLPGFVIEAGMACSLGSLFQLAPSAAQFEPQLFTRILPMLRSNEALVLSLYIRTGQTEQKKGGRAAPVNEATTTKNHAKYRQQAETILQCALQLEKAYLEKKSSFSRVVWMVVTDSPYVKTLITESYDTRRVANSRREVVSTQSRGTHSQAAGGSSSTVAFAEAIIDWYLIGESDLVVSDDKAPSFGGTGALRTARPFYNAPSCSRAILR